MQSQFKAKIRPVTKKMRDADAPQWVISVHYSHSKGIKNITEHPWCDHNPDFSTLKDTFALVWVIIKTAHGVASSWDFQQSNTPLSYEFEYNELCRHLHCQHARKKIWGNCGTIHFLFKTHLMKHSPLKSRLPPLCSASPLFPLPDFYWFQKIC